MPSSPVATSPALGAHHHEMPFSEKKGRFTVSVTEAVRPPAGCHLQQQQEAPAQAPAGSPTASPLTRAVKRGRFLVSCMPYGGSSSPNLAATLSLQQEGVGLFPTATAPASRSTCSSDDMSVTAMDLSSTAAAAAAAAAPEVTSPCRLPVQRSPEPPRRVRFSKTAEDLCTVASAPPAQPCLQQLQQQADQQAAAAAAAGASSRRALQPELPKQLTHTRSYCSGRFLIQEAAYTQGCLHRSTSAPECPAGGLSSSLSSCSSMQATYGPFASAHALGSSSPGAGSSGSGTGCFAQSEVDLCAANQLMSGLVALQQHQQAQQQQLQHQQQREAALFMYHQSTAGLLPAAGAAAGATAGGLLSSASVPVFPLLSSASSEEEGSMVSSLLSSNDLLASSDGGAAAAAAAAGGGSGAFSSAQRASGHTSASCNKRRGSNSNLLSSCYNGSAELLSAAAAAAAAGHQQHQHHHQHVTPKRSSSMTYFRRGRFLVQTTMS